MEPLAAPILAIAAALDEARAFHPVGEPGHRRRHDVERLRDVADQRAVITPEKEQHAGLRRRQIVRGRLLLDGALQPPIGHGQKEDQPVFRFHAAVIYFACETSRYFAREISGDIRLPFCGASMHRHPRTVKCEDEPSQPL